MRRTALLAWVLTAAAIAHAAPPTKMLVPGLVSVLTNTVATVPNVLTCFTMPAPRTITATKIAVQLTGGTGTNTSSWGVYPNADAGALLIALTTTDSAAVKSASGLTPAAFTAGALYRVCYCGAAAANLSFMAVTQAVSCCQDTNVTTLIQAFHPSYVGVAANPCTGTAVLPATTGAITPDATTPGRGAPKVPVILLEQ